MLEKEDPILKKEMLARKKHLIPLPMQNFLLSIIPNPLLNLDCYMKLPRIDINIEKFEKAVNKVLKNNPILLSTFEKKSDGSNLIYYEPSLFKEVKIEKISEKQFKDFIESDKTPTKFNPYNKTPLINIRIFLTDENIYLYEEMHHLIFDGFSGRILDGSIEDAYLDKEMKINLFYSHLLDYNNKINSKEYNETKKYYEETFKNSGINYFDIDIDKEKIDRENKVKMINIISEELKQKIELKFKDKYKDVNIVLIMNLLLGKYIISNFKDNHPIVAFTHNGRNSNTKNILGPIYTRRKATFDFSKEFTIKDFFEKTKEQFQIIKKLIELPLYYSENNSEYIVNYYPFNFGIASFNGKPIEFKVFNLKKKDPIPPSPLYMNFEQNPKDLPNKVKISFSFNRYKFKDETAEKLSKLLVQTLNFIIDNFDDEQKITKDILKKFLKTLKD